MSKEPLILIRPFIIDQIHSNCRFLISVNREVSDFEESMSFQTFFNNFIESNDERTILVSLSKYIFKQGRKYEGR